MADHQILDTHLAGWLEPATVALSEEELLQRRSAVITLADSVTAERAADLILAAHGQFGTQRQWLVDAIRAHDETFVGDGKDALVALIAAAAVADALDNPSAAKRSVLALLAQSARYLGLRSAIETLHELSDAAAHDAFLQARRRRGPMANAVVSLQKTLKDAGSTDADQIQNWDVMSAHLKARDKALQSLAKRLDDLVESLDGRLSLRDEEVDILWWTHSARSISAREPWSSIKPAIRRAVMAVSELHGLSRHALNPIGTRALLAGAIGKDVNSETQLGEISATAASEGVLSPELPRALLLPITSTADVYRDLGDGDDTWRVVAERTLGIDTMHARTLLEGAEQMMRELEIRRLSRE